MCWLVYVILVMLPYTFFTIFQWIEYSESMGSFPSFPCKDSTLSFLENIPLLTAYKIQYFCRVPEAALFISKCVESHFKLQCSLATAKETCTGAHLYFLHNMLSKYS